MAITIDMPVQSQWCNARRDHSGKVGTRYLFLCSHYWFFVMGKL